LPFYCIILWLKTYMEHAARTCVLLILVLLTAACGRGDDKKISSQVAAKVNGDEISVHQVNFALAHSGVSAPDQVKKAAPRILEKLIDQQLLARKATEAKLDRDP